MVHSTILKGVAAVAIAATMIGASTAGAPTSQSLVGKTAPPLTVNGWLNAPAKGLNLPSLRGKVVVLDFWAYW